MDFTIKTDSDKVAVVSYISRLPSEKEYEVSVSVVNGSRKRSSPQNKTYWMWIGIISKETGNSAEDLHKVFASMFLGKEVFEIMGQRIAKPRSTATLKSDEFSTYLDQIEAFCATELNIILPKPDEYNV